MSLPTRFSVFASLYHSHPNHGNINECISRQVVMTTELAPESLERPDIGESIFCLPSHPNAPPSTLRSTLDHPTLVIGHGSDPIHPFTDADTLTNGMPNARLFEARSIWEWRVWPARLDAELLSFLEQVWTPQSVRFESADQLRSEHPTRPDSRSRKRFPGRPPDVGPEVG